MNFKKICFALIATVIISCDDNTIEEFDYVEQYKTEKPLIDEYLANHYFDDVAEEVKDIDANQTALVNDENLQVLTDTVNEVVYTMYAYVYEQGENDEAGTPDEDDRVNISYFAYAFEDEDVVYQNDINDGFVNLSTDMKGFRTGLAVFQGGYASEVNLETPREYTGVGKGFIIMPSGLSVTSDFSYTQDVRNANQPLLYMIEVKSVISQGDEE